MESSALFLDFLDLGVELVSDCSDCGVLSAFFLVFLDLVVELVSDWSVDCGAWGWDAAREATLAAKKSTAATSEGRTDLRKKGMMGGSFRPDEFSSSSATWSWHVGVVCQ